MSSSVKRTGGDADSKCRELVSAKVLTCGAGCSLRASKEAGLAYTAKLASLPVSAEPVAIGRAASREAAAGGDCAVCIRTLQSDRADARGRIEAGLDPSCRGGVGLAPHARAHGECLHHLTLQGAVHLCSVARHARLVPRAVSLQIVAFLALGQQTSLNAATRSCGAHVACSARARALVVRPTLLVPESAAHALLRLNSPLTAPEANRADFAGVVQLATVSPDRTIGALSGADRTGKLASFARGAREAAARGRLARRAHDAR